jgi:hypothetical protein
LWVVWVVRRQLDQVIGVCIVNYSKLLLHATLAALPFFAFTTLFIVVETGNVALALEAGGLTGVCAVLGAYLALLLAYRRHYER